MDWKLIAVGCAGGAIPDILRIIQGRYSGSLPAYLSTPNFWIGLAFLMAIAGLATWLGSGKDVKEALAFGYSAPELISRLLSTREPPTRSEFSLKSVLHFWSY